MEQKRCKLCGSKEYKIVHIKENFIIVKCKNCKVYYVLNPLKEDDSLHWYNRLHSEGSYRIENEFIQLKVETLKSLLNFLPDDGKTAIDIGCGDGLFVSMLKSRGWKVFGVETSLQAIKNIKTDIEDIIIGKIEEINLSEESFDLAVMIDSLEHFYNPLFVLEKTYKLLKKNGTLLITTPNIRSINSIIFRKHWVHLRPREHIFYFSPETISQILERTGFKVQKIKKFARKINVFYLINRLSFHYPGIYKYVQIFDFIPESIKRIPFNFYSGELLILVKKL